MASPPQISSHTLSLLQEVLRSQQSCIHELSSLNHELSSLNRDLASVTYTTTSPWTSPTSHLNHSLTTVTHTRALPWSPYYHYHYPNPNPNSNPPQTFPINTNTSTVNSELPKPPTIPFFSSQSSKSLKPLAVASFPTPPSPPQQPSEQSHSTTAYHNVPDPLTTRPTHQQPLPVPPPQPPTSISLSLSSPPAKPPPDGKISTSPDLTRSDVLTPLSPLLQPPLKRPPEPPDAVPSQSSTLCAPSEPPEPPRALDTRRSTPTTSESEPPDDREQMLTWPPPPLPEPPDRVSLSLLLLPSKPQNQDASSSPDLTNPDPLTPQLPFLQPWLMPSPKHPDPCVPQLTLKFRPTNKMGLSHDNSAAKSSFGASAPGLFPIVSLSSSQVTDEHKMESYDNSDVGFDQEGNLLVTPFLLRVMSTILYFPILRVNISVSVHVIIFYEHNLEALMNALSLLILSGTLSNVVQANGFRSFGTGRQFPNDGFALNSITNYARLIEHVQQFALKFLSLGLTFLIHYGAWSLAFDLVWDNPREHRFNLTLHNNVMLGSHMFTNIGSYLIPLVEYKKLIPSIEFFFSTIPNLLHRHRVTQWLEFVLNDILNICVNNIASSPSWAYALSKLLSQLQVVMKICYLLEFECSNDMQYLLEPPLGPESDLKISQLVNVLAGVEFQDLPTYMDTTLFMVEVLETMFTFSIRILTRQQVRWRVLQETLLLQDLLNGSATEMITRLVILFEWLFFVWHTPFYPQHALCVTCPNYYNRCCSHSGSQIENIIFAVVTKASLGYCELAMEWLIAWVWDIIGRQFWAFIMVISSQFKQWDPGKFLMISIFLQP